MESKYKVEEQPYESLNELSLNNLSKLTEIPLEIVRKLCNPGTDMGLNEDELAETSKSSVAEIIGLEGIRKLHYLGEIERISLEELKRLYFGGAGGLLGVPSLQRLCNAGVTLKINFDDFQDLVSVMYSANLTVEDIVKLSVTGALGYFSNEAIMWLADDDGIKSISTENLKKFCSMPHSEICYDNMKKIFANQEIITHLDTKELSRLCDHAEFLHGVASENLVDAVLTMMRRHGKANCLSSEQPCVL